MKYAYHSPNKLLKDYVRTILVMEGNSDADQNNLPLFTNGMPALFCKTETNGTAYQNILEVSLFGNTIPAQSWALTSSATIIVYFFKPFALTSLLKVAAKDLARGPIDLCNWNPHKYNALKTQLIYADTAPGKLEVFDSLLIQQHQENRGVYELIQHATETLMCNPATEVLNELLTELKLNERTFQRIFKKYVGVTPTQYRRISQFQLSFDQLRSKKFNKISEVAFDNGFADQSHFIRSFKEFAHTTPTNYLQNGLKGKK